MHPVGTVNAVLYETFETVNTALFETIGTMNTVLYETLPYESLQLDTFLKHRC